MHDEEIRAAFDQVQADWVLKERTLAAVTARTSPRARRARVRRMAAALACFLLVLLGAGGYLVYFTPTAAVSLEGDSGLSLSVNRFDRVIGVSSYGSADSALTDDLEHMDCARAVEQVLSGGTLGAGTEPVELTVTGDDPDQSRELLERVSACTSHYGNVHCSSGSSEEAAQAQAAGLPLGKYRLFVELQALDPSVTAEDVQGMTMSELRQRLADAQSAASGGAGSTAPSSGQAGSGTAVDTGAGSGNSYGTGSGNGYGSGHHSEEHGQGHSGGHH